jgi:hypothetical protein
MDEIAAEIMTWITSRYGPVTVETTVVATVPVHDGIATGKGSTQSEAIAALYADLTGGVYEKGEA